jgi:integrase
LVADLIDLYMAHYAGRDPTRLQRLNWWSARLGQVALQDLSDDQVAAALDELSTRRSRYYAGKDEHGQPIHHDRKRHLAPATINRYAASLSAVLTWAIRRRVAPKGYAHPCRGVERRTENNEKTRFLSDDERKRLLQACRDSTWPRLYLLVLLALTSGARKGELLGLRWEDIDLGRGEAHVGRTKNGDPRVLVLVPAVIEELRKFEAAAGLVFPSVRSKGRPYAIDPKWHDALTAAKVRTFRFHDLRHSAASLLAQNGATLLEIADVLGHRQLAMTKRYSHLTTQHKAAHIGRVMGSLE